MIAAHKGTKTGVFSVKAWESGQPQRYGWVADIDVTPRKTIPAEILEFAEIRKKVVPEPVEPPVVAPSATVEPVQAAARPKPKRKPTAKKGAKK